MRRIKIAEIISRDRFTTIEKIYLEIEGEDIMASRATIRRDVDYLIKVKKYGIETVHGGRSGIKVKDNWYYSRPITAIDIKMMEHMAEYLPDDMKEEYLKSVKKLNRIREDI